MLGHFILISTLLLSSRTINGITPSPSGIERQSFRKNALLPIPGRQGDNGGIDNEKQAASAPFTTSKRSIYGGENNKSGLVLAIKTGLILAFTSGFTNGICLSGLLSSGGEGNAATPKQAVAAVTGTYTISALSAAGAIIAPGNQEGNNLIRLNQLSKMAFQLKILSSYITGSAAAGFLTPKPVAFLLQSSYGPTFLLASLCLFASSILAPSSSSSFGEGSMSYLYLAAIANGIQNSITSTHTSNLVRSSHYTGMSSDIGTFLGQLLRGNGENLFKLKVFTSLSASFWMGAFVSFFFITKYGASSFLFGATVYALLGFALIIDQYLTKKVA